MNTYEQLAEKMLALMDAHRHTPPEPVSGVLRGEMAVLRLLGEEEDGMSAGTISSTLHMTTSRIAAVLGSLEKKDLIEREADENDRRRVLVNLTEKGRAYHRARRQEAKMHMQELLKNLGPEDAATFVRIAGRVLSFAPPPPPTSPQIIHSSEEKEPIHE